MIQRVGEPGTGSKYRGRVRGHFPRRQGSPSKLGAIARAMEDAPGDSLVEQAGSVAALEATYRFFSNERVSPEAIFDGHAVKPAERASAHERVLVVHDTTEFRFGGAKQRTGLGRVSPKKRDGFLAHYSLCLAPDGDPLGTLELFAWSRLDEEKRPKATASFRNPNRESQRWIESGSPVFRRSGGYANFLHADDVPFISSTHRRSARAECTGM